MAINNMRRSFLNDWSLWFLLLSNSVTIFFALKEDWHIGTVLWIYLVQSIAIGIFNFVRILQLKKFSTEGFLINDQPVEPTRKTKISTAFFFLLHFSLFHLMYVMLLLAITDVSISSNGSGTVGLPYLLLAAVIFFINHWFSYLYNRRGGTEKQNIGLLMAYPYVRIIPMYFMIVIGSIFWFGGFHFLFFVLKTFADVSMHVIEHAVLRKGGGSPIPIT